MITSRVVVVRHPLVHTVPFMGVSVFRYITITAIHDNMMDNASIFLLDNGFKLKRKRNKNVRSKAYHPCITRTFTVDRKLISFNLTLTE